jgi:SAM-dependent methyltransferase
MVQHWDPEAYGREGAFVHGLAGNVVEWLAPQAGERILDLGCGDGQLTLKLMAAGARMVGVDSSTAMVQSARERGVDAVEGEAERLPFPDTEFDAVFSNAALHWVRGQDEMMAEVHRVLKPGGRFVAEMGGHGNIAAIVVALRSALARHGLEEREEAVNYFPTPEAYAARLTRHGFRVERMELIPRPTLLPESGIRGWLATFRSCVLDGLPEAVREQVVSETEALLKPALCDEAGRWTADYVRLRFKAVKESEPAS